MNDRKLKEIVCLKDTEKSNKITIMKKENTKEITIKKSDWKKINELINKVDDIVEKLDNSDFGLKIYDDLTKYFKELRGKIIEISRETKETGPQLTEIWEKGFLQGIGFVDDELEDWISEGILTRQDQGYFKKNYDWDKQVSKRIKQEKKTILKGSEL